MSLIIPPKYKLKLLPETTEMAIKMLKDAFQERLSKTLNLRRVTAPLFVLSGTGLNDDLNGSEREVVHSLAKWKRVKLGAYDIAPGFGLYTDMNAIRTHEELDNLHSLYVDQWDWEKTITREDRNVEYLKKTVKSIYKVIKECESLTDFARRDYIYTYRGVVARVSSFVSERTGSRCCPSVWSRIPYRYRTAA